MTEIVVIKGVEYPVAFPTGAIREFEEVTGTSVLNSRGQEKIGSIGGIVALCWIGLKWGTYKFDGVAPKSKLTQLQLTDMLPMEEFSNPDGPVAKIMKVFFDSMPKAKNGEAAGNAA